MKDIRAGFTITVPDFRNAYYFITAVRNKTFLRVFLLLTVFELFHLVGSLTGLWTLNRILAAVYVPFLIWMLILLANAEKQIKKYIRSGSHLLGCAYTVDIYERKLHILVPERNVDVTLKISDVSYAFSTHKLFLIYYTSQDLYLLPKRAFSPEEQEAISKMLQSKLPEPAGLLKLLKR